MAGEALFYGIGDPWVQTLNAPTGIGENVILPLEIFEFEYTEDASNLEAKSQRKGIKRTIASAIGEVTSTVKISTQFGNWSHLEFFTNQFSSVETSVAIPGLKSGRVPSSSPYEITDAGITTGTLAGIYIYVYDEQESSYRKKETSAPSAGEVQVDTTNTKLIFHSSDAGKYFAYTLPVTETNVDRLGGGVGDSYGTIQFWGTVYGPEWKINFPSLDFKSAPTISLNGDVTTLEVEFSANVVPGDDKPYRLYKV